MNSAIRDSLACAAAILLTFIPSSCSDQIDGEDPRNLSKITITGGNNQTDRIGAELELPLTVRVTDLVSNPRVGEPVRFSTEDAGANVNPAITSTDAHGYASAWFTLGTTPGSQHAGVAIDGDSTAFNFTAEALGCPEEDPDGACAWPAGYVYITTTSSSLISGSVSALIECDPETGNTELILQTGLTLTDVGFSSRGELFVATATDVYKVDPVGKSLSQYAQMPVLTGSEIEPNMGGILLMAGSSNVYTFGCPGDPASLLAEYSILRYENLAVDPNSRDFYVVAGNTPTFNFILNEWDGRGSVTNTTTYIMNTLGTPRGICVDNNGVLYVSIDSDGINRSIGRLDPGVSNEPKWFDFYAYFSENDHTAGRWGDIAVYEEKLFLIDTRMNRFVVLWTEGTTDEEKWYEAYPSNVFSLELTDSERYGIAVAPGFDCPL